MAPQKWLITGGAGFIGRNCVIKLLRDTAHRIRVYDNESVGTRKALYDALDKEVQDGSVSSPAVESRLEFVHGDILNGSMLETAADGCSVIVHLAANTGVPVSIEDPLHDCRTNVQGTLQVLDTARRCSVAHVVSASSGAAAGECSPPVHEEIVPRPVSPYGAGKLASEAYCHVFSSLYGINTVSLRFGNVYGPHSGHKSSVVAKFITRALQGSECEIYGDGTQTRDFIYTEDLTDAIFRAARFMQGGEVFQIATSREHTVNEVAHYIQQSLHERGHSMIVRHGDARKGDVYRNFSDTSKAKRLLGWESTTALTQGIERTVEWFLARRSF